jgi:hypothetical protein
MNCMLVGHYDRYVVLDAGLMFPECARARSGAAPLVLARSPGGHMCARVLQQADAASLARAQRL